ncbi:MAG: Gfo/Idh/MocA family oxidoreductase [Bacteroidetes bacterium]|nr:Gfo/Idh/MocA family oxidoreductase [Bacteroidota bacterium]
MKIISERKLRLPLRKDKKLKWGVSGLGRFAEFSFLPALTQSKKNKLISLYSSNLGRAKNLAGLFSADFATDDFKKFLESDINAVYIAGANIDHYSQVIEAAKAGKHILCEKPLAVTSAQAEEMVKICKENNVQLAVNYLYRINPLVKKAKELIQKQMLGKIVSVSISFYIDLAPSNNFRFNKEKSGGGALRDLGTHTIDLLRYFGGEISEISGYTDNIVYKSDVDDFATGLIKFQKSGYGRFTVSFNAQKAFNRIEIVGYNGCLSIENIFVKKNSPGKLTIDLNGEAKKAFLKRANNLQLHLKSLYHSFSTNTSPEIPGEDGLINLQLMEKLEQNVIKK